MALARAFLGDQGGGHLDPSHRSIVDYSWPAENVEAFVADHDPWRWLMRQVDVERRGLPRRVRSGRHTWAAAPSNYPVTRIPPMSNLTPQSPLMQPVTLDGQTYFTSQYFHAQYQQNTPGQGKHTRLDSFMRLLQSMEAYGVYVEQGDICNLSWGEVKSRTTESGSVNLYKDLQPFFAAAGYNPLTFLNATAQAALSHHLDDLTSQAMSVSINRQVGRKAQPAPALRTVEQDLAFFQSCLTLLRDIGQLEARDTLMVADKVRTLLIGPAGSPGGGTAALPTFFVADRVRELGYHLSRQQEASLVIPLSKKVAAEYRLRHKDDLDPETRKPRQALRYVDGAARGINYYAREAASWIDPIVQSYLVSVLGSGLSRQEGTP